MTTLFTTSTGKIIEYNNTELQNILVNLDATITSATTGNDNVVFIHVNSNILLLMDVAKNYNRKLYEMYDVEWDENNVYNLKFFHKALIPKNQYS